MFQRGKLSHWCLSPFVYFLFYPLAVPLVSYGAQAQTVSSKSETQDALEKISDFLRNETGAAWLAGLAQSQKKAAVTTDELMEAVLGATEENSTVWRAAATLRSALTAQAEREKMPSTNVTTTSSEPAIDYWNDVITDMEKHDDIICLYKKDTEAKMKKSSDWQKFLENVSPGYTVHLALDRGSKYVICLKKVNVSTSQTSETPPPTILVSTVEDISSTTSMSTQVTQISENDEDSATTINHTTQPSVSVTTAKIPTIQAMRSLIQTVTPSAIQENSSSSRGKKDCGKGNAYELDSVKNSKDGIPNSSKTNNKTACRESKDELEPENSESPPRLIVELTTAQNVKNYEGLDEDVTASSKCDCSEESDTPEIIKSPRIAKPSDPEPQSSSTGGSGSPLIIAQANCLPCCMNPINILNPCPFLKNVVHNLHAPVKPSKQRIGSYNGNFEYSSQIPLQPFIPVEKDFERESWLPKLLSERRESAYRLPLPHPPMIPSYQVIPDYSKALPAKFGMQEVRKPLISNAKVSLRQLHPIIPGYGSLSNAPISSNPSFLLPQKNHRAPCSAEFSGARENPFSVKPIAPFYQREYYPPSLMKPNFRFPENLPLRAKPLALPQTNRNPGILQRIGKLGFKPCRQNPSIPKCRKNSWAQDSRKILPFDEPAFPLPSISSNIFPNSNPTVHRNSFPGMAHRNQNCDQLPSLPNYSSRSSGFGANFAPKLTIEKKYILQGFDKDSVASGDNFSNSLSPIPLVRYSHNMHLTPKMPIQNDGYGYGDIHSSMPKIHVPESLNMANKNSIKRNMTSIDYSMAPVRRGVNKSIRKKVGNAVNFSDYFRTTIPVLVPKNLFNAWRITGQEKINEPKSHKSHDRTCPNSCREPIPIKRKVHGSKSDSTRVNVVPGKGERMKTIDKKKGLFNVQWKKESTLSDEVFHSKKNFVKEPSKKSAKLNDGAKSLATRVDETADEFEKPVHRKNLIKDKVLAGTTASSLMDSDIKRVKKYRLQRRRLRNRITLGEQLIL